MGHLQRRDRGGRVVDYDKAAPMPEMRRIDYGLGGLNVRAFEFVDPAEPDVSTLQRRLVAAGELCGYKVTERFYEIGTAKALAETDAFLRS